MLAFKQYTVAAVFLLVGATAVAADDAKPWALRDHYSFKGPHSVFKFDVQTGEWMVHVDDFGELVRSAQCELVFGDGEVVRLSSLGSKHNSRDAFEGPLGKGTRFRSIFETKNGLKVDLSIARFPELPFLLIQVTVENTGKKPVVLKEIRPVVFDPGSVADLKDSIVVTQAHTRRRGNFSVVHGDSTAGLVIFELPDPRMTLGVGLLRSGLMDSYVDLQPNGQSYAGMVRCEYTPSLTVLPGMKVGADPVWISLFVPEREEVYQYYAWAELAGMTSARAETMPSGWITVAAGESAQALYDAADAWSPYDITYALVPAQWQASPGSIDGRQPDYPKDMSKLAGELAQRGVRPGITIDPLAAPAGDKSWVLTSSDGRHWLDLSRPKARGHVTKRIRKLIEAGYRFFVIEPSDIPDDILSQYNVTRAQADLYGLQLATESAQGLPVLPSPGMTLRDELPLWREAGRTTETLQSYGIVAGPLRIRTGELNAVSSALRHAIENYYGPLEIVGMPKKKVRKAVGVACCSVGFAGVTASR